MGDDVSDISERERSRRVEQRRRALRYADLKPEKNIPYSREHIRRLEAVGKFPKHFHFAAENGAAAWWEDEIDDLLEARAALREEEVTA